MQTSLPNVHFITGLLAGRVYVIEDPDGLALIDASLPPSVGPILSQIKALGKSPRAVKRILITRAHPDQVGDQPRLKALTGAQIVASAIEQPVIEGQVPVPRVPLEKLRGPIKFRPPNITFKPVAVDRPWQVDLGLEIVCFGHGQPLRQATPVLQAFGRTIGVV